MAKCCFCGKFIEPKDLRIVAETFYGKKVKAHNDCYMKDKWRQQREGYEKSSGFNA